MVAQQRRYSARSPLPVGVAGAGPRPAPVPVAPARPASPTSSRVPRIGPRPRAGQRGQRGRRQRAGPGGGSSSRAAVDVDPDADHDRVAGLLGQDPGQLAPRAPARRWATSARRPRRPAGQRRGPRPPRPAAAASPGPRRAPPPGAAAPRRSAPRRGGLAQRRPSRPRPRVWCSAASTAPSAAPALAAASRSRWWTRSAPARPARDHRRPGVSTARAQLGFRGRREAHHRCSAPAPPHRTQSVLPIRHRLCSPSSSRSVKGRG